tara:strand:+ start:733 stop:954 length:222 start_codon:yes stop_codon:yes gene_type:complete
MLDYEVRVSRLETISDKQDMQIAKLFSKVDDTNIAIQKINNSLLQIKWGIYGAIIWYVVQQVGIIEAFRMATL